MRLAEGTSISGRLEVLSPGIGWGGVCNAGWTALNTRVACRQLGFLDGAGSYHCNHIPAVSLVLFQVSCFGNENVLFDCNSTATPTETCTDPVCIQCVCHQCFEFLLQVPGQKDATTQSAVSFEWHLKHNITAFEFLFLSQKNPQTLLYVENGKVIQEHTRFLHRIQLINVDYETVGFNLTNLTVADMGIYSLFVPNRLLTSKAVLIVTDFAVVPDPVVHRQINDAAVLSWDLVALRQLSDISCEILLTTPATGRLHLDYYNTYWLRDNPHRHSVLQPTDKLHPTIVIDKLTAKDAGNYGVEVILTSSVYQWLNFSWQFATNLVVDDIDSDSNVPIPTIVLGILLGLAVTANIGLICVYPKRMNKKQKDIKDYLYDLEALREQLSNQSQLYEPVPRNDVQETYIRDPTTT